MGVCAAAVAVASVVLALAPRADAKALEDWDGGDTGLLVAALGAVLLLLAFVFGTLVFAHRRRVRALMANPTRFSTKKRRSSGFPTLISQSSMPRPKPEAKRKTVDSTSSMAMSRSSMDKQLDSWWNEKPQDNSLVLSDVPKPAHFYPAGFSGY